jgi:hypothetical protein
MCSKMNEISSEYFLIWVANFIVGSQTYLFKFLNCCMYKFLLIPLFIFKSNFLSIIKIIKIIIVLFLTNIM